MHTLKRKRRANEGGVLSPIEKKVEPTRDLVIRDRLTGTRKRRIQKRDLQKRDSGETEKYTRESQRGTTPGRRDVEILWEGV